MVKYKDIAPEARNKKEYRKNSRDYYKKTQKDTPSTGSCTLLE